MKPPKYDIAVVLINYNSTNYTLESVEKVIEKTASEVNYQVIVVDNCSRNEEFKKLKENFPNAAHISLHRSDLNTGFGGGNIFGTQYADAKYLLFLNNDALLINDCLSILYAYMESHPEVGVATAQNYDENNTFVPSFDHDKGLRRLLFGRGFLERINPEKYPQRKKEYYHPLTVNWVNGAFMFSRAEAYSLAGGFDPEIFLYFEEMDICHRLRKKGYTSVLVPEAKILHYQGVSIGTSKVINKEGYLSYLYVIRKNHGWFKYVLTKLYLAIVLILKPKKWYLLSTIVWTDRSKSMKFKQEVTPYED